MKFEMGNCVALGVPNQEDALKVYRDTLGFEVTQEAEGWTELTSGPLKLYLVPDKVREPCFEILVDDVAEAEGTLAGAGFVKVDLAPDELFMRDPFGYIYCVTPRKESGE